MSEVLTDHRAKETVSWAPGGQKSNSGPAPAFGNTYAGIKGQEQSLTLFRKQRERTFIHTL